MGENEEQKKILEIQAIYKELQDRAHSEFHAVVVSPFSQSFGPVKAYSHTTKKSYDGICRALVDRWIIAHSKEGSLWNELYETRFGQTCLKIDEMKRLVAEFNEGISYSPFINGPKNQLRVSEKKLRRNGIIPRLELSSGESMTDKSSFGKRGPMGAALATEIVSRLAAFKSFGRGVGCYVTVNISGDGGHVMCFYLGGTSGAISDRLPFSDIAFFDPNVGEYWFGKTGTATPDFEGFFRVIFNGCYKRYNSFVLRCYAPQA